MKKILYIFTVCLLIVSITSCSSQSNKTAKSDSVITKLSNDEIRLRIKETIKNNTNVRNVISRFEKYSDSDYPYDFNIIMDNRFFYKELSEQYSEIMQIYDDYVEILSNCGVYSDECFITIFKNGIDKGAYNISGNGLWLPHLDITLDRDSIESNPNILFQYEMKDILQANEDNNYVISNDIDLIGDYIKNVKRGDMVIVGTSKDNWNGAIEKLAKSDNESLKEMFNDGKIFFVDVDTSFNILSEGFSTMEIKITSGDYSGVVGWVGK